LLFFLKPVCTELDSIPPRFRFFPPWFCSFETCLLPPPILSFFPFCGWSFLPLSRCSDLSFFGPYLAYLSYPCRSIAIFVSGQPSSFSPLGWVFLIKLDFGLVRLPKPPLSDSPIELTVAGFAACTVQAPFWFLLLPSSFFFFILLDCALDFFMFRYTTVSVEASFQ